MTEQAAKPRNRGCARSVAIGCASVVLLLGIGGLLAYHGLKDFLPDTVDKYTDTVSLEFPAVDASQKEVDSLLGHVRDFSKAVQDGEEPPDMVLTSRDINILLNRHPGWTNMAGRVCVSIEDDKVRGQISLPLDEVGAMLDGRYLNGSAVFRLEMAAGRLLVFVDSAEVQGESLPEWVMNALRADNLAKEANKNPGTAEILKKLDTITVEAGTLRIVPKRGS